MHMRAGIMMTIAGFALVTQWSDVQAQRRTVPLYGATMAETCEQWTAEMPTRSSEHAHVQSAWLFGFVSGVASATLTRPSSLVFPDDLGTADMEAQMSQYCADHPRSAIPVAAMRLIASLSARER
jgi:hypothetical protein